LRELRRPAAAEGWRLLRVLLFWLDTLPAKAGEQGFVSMK